MATTPNYSLSIYDSSDTDVRFLDFRVAIAGTQTTSNFYVIDGALKEHSDAINTLKNSPQAYIVKANFASGVYNASVSGFPGYKTNQLIVLSLNQTNTGAVSININNSSAKNVMLYNANGILRNFIAGEFVSNSPALCYYDGTQFVTIGIPRGSATYVDGERGDVLQISSDGAIESSGKQIGNPNGIATLDENGNVVQVANMANSAAAVYSGEPVTIEYADENRIGSVTAYGNNSQTSGTTTAPISMNGVDSVQVSGNNLFLNNAETETKSGITFTVNPDKSVTVNGTNSTSGSVVFYTGYNESLPAGSYTLSGASSLTGSAEVEIKIKRARGTFEWLASNSSLHTRTLNIATGDIIASFYVAVGAGRTADNVKVYPMLNVGSTALPYEPYNGNITQLPIPRELHRIGEAADKCITRVKSVYDKRIVLDGSESWTEYNDENWKGDGYHVYRFYDADAVIGQPIASNKYPSRMGSNNFKGTLGVATGVQSILFSVIEQKTVDDWKAYLAAQKAAGTPLIIYRQSTSYNGTNGLDVCLTEYQTGYIEIDGETVRGSYTQNGEQPYSVVQSPSVVKTAESLICSSANVENQNLNWGYMYASNNPLKNFVFGLIGSDITSVTEVNAYFAAQKAAGTPVQIVYQLATPEQYATDPIDFNNAAGPLTVVTGGQVEVKMTDFITDRTPAFLNKLDKTGDGSDVTVTFTEASTDTDIASGAKMSILFGKILKRFSTITSKFTTVDNSITQIESDISDITDGTTVVAQANKVTNALVIMSNSGTALVNYDGSATANMTLSPSNVGAEPAFTKNTAFNKNFGSSAGTVCQGDDGRLSNARRSSNISMSLSGTNLSISYS